MKVQKAVNRTILTESIKAAEENGPLSNRQLLYGAVAERYNLAIGPNSPKLWVTPSIVLLRIAEWQLKVKTPKGQRGRPKGTKLPPKLDVEGNPIKRVRKGRKASDTNMNAMRAGEFAGPQYQGLLSRIANGSLTARIKANCLACAGFVREEIKHCQCTACPLWDVRPYRTQTPSGLNESSESNEITLDTIAEDSKMNTIEVSTPELYQVV